MNEEDFSELVNLYLDKEITERGLAQLKCELAANVERKDEFAEHCRMHQAMLLALNPQPARRRFKFWRSGSNSSFRSSRSSEQGLRTFSNMSPQV